MAETVNLIKAGKLSRRPRALGAKLDRIDNIADPYQVSLTLPQGWLDPLALMNFKVLPPGADPDSADFAADPRGSGPYVYAKDVRTDEGRPCVAFAANPNYAARPGKAGLPRIDEIHFVAYSFKDEKDPKSDHKEELAAALEDGPGRLDLLLDLDAREAATLAKNAANLHIRMTGRARRTGGFISWRSTTRSRTWTTRPSAAPWPTRSTATSCWTTTSARRRAGPAFVAERPLPRRVVGGQPQAGQEARRQDHVRPVRRGAGQGEAGASRACRTPRSR